MNHFSFLSFYFSSIKNNSTQFERSRDIRNTNENHKVCLENPITNNQHTCNDNPIYKDKRNVGLNQHSYRNEHRGLNQIGIELHASSEERRASYKKIRDSISEVESRLKSREKILENLRELYTEALVSFQKVIDLSIEQECSPQIRKINNIMDLIKTGQNKHANEKIIKERNIQKVQKKFEYDESRNQYRTAEPRDSRQHLHDDGKKDLQNDRKSRIDSKNIEKNQPVSKILVKETPQKSVIELNSKIKSVSHQCPTTPINDIKKYKEYMRAVNFLENLGKQKKLNAKNKQIRLEDGSVIPYFIEIMGRSVFYIGAGAFGNVYGACYSNKNRFSAIKCIKIPERSTEDTLNLTEIAALKIAKHKNVIGLEDWYIGESSLFIVLEYASQSLYSYIGEKSLVNMFMEQILTGVEYIHSKNIIHRDLKPANILVTRNQIIKIADFGAACIGVSGKKRITDRRYGTIAYMAPEMWYKESEYSYSADLFSIGVIAHILYTRNYLAQMSLLPSRKDLVSAIKDEDLFALRINMSIQDSKVRQLVIGCCKLDPESRLTIKEARNIYG